MVFDITGLQGTKCITLYAGLHSFIYGPTRLPSWNSILSGKKTNILLILKRKLPQPHIKYTDYFICVKSYTLNTENSNLQVFNKPTCKTVHMTSQNSHFFSDCVYTLYQKKCLFTSHCGLSVIPGLVDTNQSPTVSCGVGKPTFFGSYLLSVKTFEGKTST